MIPRLGRILLVLACTAALVPFLWSGTSSCRKPSKTETTDPIAPWVRLSRAELFTGELKRLEPHLRLTASGCVRMEITVPITIGIESELWLEGKRAKSLIASQLPGQATGEMSFSLQEVKGVNGQRQFRFVLATTEDSGSSAMTTELDQPEPVEGGSMSTTAQLREPLDLPEGQYVPIWAFVVHKGLTYDGSQIHSMEDAVKASHWAILIKAKWERPDRK